MSGFWLWVKAHPIIAALTAGGVLLLPRAAKAKEAKTGEPGSKPAHEKGMAKVRARIREATKAAGMSKEAQAWAENFAVIQAASESGGDNFRGLGEPRFFPSWAVPTGAKKENGKWTIKDGASEGLIKLQNAETKAAQLAYKRNKERGTLPQSDASYEEWTFGSGGDYGGLPANLLYPFRKGEPGEFHPYDVFDKRRSAVGMLAYMQRLSQWGTFKDRPGSQNVDTLKAGFASPDLMGKPDASRSKSSALKARANAKKYGVPASFFTSPMPYELKQGRDWLKLIRKIEGRA